MSKFVVIIERDDDHTAHVWSDIERYGGDDGGRAGAMWREEIEKIDAGEWHPYGVTTARVCECCGQIEEEYVTALWGCVVDSADQEGRYVRPDEITDDYLREVAREKLAEAEVS